MSMSISNGFVTSPGVVGAMSADRVEQLVLWDLNEQLRQHRRVTDGVIGDFDGPNLQSLRLHAQVHFALLAIDKAAPCFFDLPFPFT